MPRDVYRRHTHLLLAIIIFATSGTFSLLAVRARLARLAERLREQPPDRYRQCWIVFLLGGPRFDSLPFLWRHAQCDYRVFAFPPRPPFLGSNLTLLLR